eukprot:scaffold281525_cov32-Tisochrysis_lutea.AAC.8
MSRVTRSSAPSRRFSLIWTGGSSQSGTSSPSFTVGGWAAPLAESSRRRRSADRPAYRRGASAQEASYAAPAAPHRTPARPLGPHQQQVTPQSHPLAERERER